MRFMTEFHQKTLQGVARHARGMLKTLKHGRKNARELAMAYTAAKIVVITLEQACQAAGVPQQVMVASEELTGDMDKVLDLLGPGWGGRR